MERGKGISILWRRGSGSEEVEGVGHLDGRERGNLGQVYGCHYDGDAEVVMSGERLVLYQTVQDWERCELELAAWQNEEGEESEEKKDA